MPSKANPSKGDKWPASIETDYERVESLGSGNFGTIWLVRKKHDGVAGGDGDDAYFAIKGIDLSKKNSARYAEREIDILSEVRHPNIIQMVHAYDQTPPTSKVRFVVMTLARGPSVGDVIKSGGALSVPLARLIARHLIAAVSYLHGRAVIHRDIKPDNCVLVLDAKNKGRYSPDESYLEDDSLWGSGPGAQEAVETGKWKIVLVDFGFARALTSKEVADDSGRNGSIHNEKKTSNAMSRASFRLSKKDEMEELQEVSRRCSMPLIIPKILEDEEMEESPSPVKQAKPKAGKRVSVARMPVRAMSALGSHFYAAPEVEKNFRKKGEADKKTETEALTEFVADYGMISDAYSVGVTLREALTGVPPNFNVTKYVDENYSPVLNLFSKLLCSKKRTRKFRYLSEIPKDASLLIGKMTKPKAGERLTVREAQMHPWICGDDGEEEYVLPQGDYPSNHGDPIVALKGTANGT
mmetsp:Transcript_9127/g.12259  ORF Transcript_9127/g.12259 Transcript_9127/m.12259 type:complete len:468 (-) Transcript_9127:302-1705(-)